MQNTPNYNLKKPDYTDFSDIMDLNSNMDVLDTNLHDVSETVDNHIGDTNIHLSSNDRTKLNGDLLAKSNILLNGSSVNFNTLEPNKVYQVGNVNGAIGAPPTSYGILAIFKPEASYILQEFTDIINNNKYTRIFDLTTNNWSTWKQATFSTDQTAKWNYGYDTYTRYPEYAKTITDWNSAESNGIYMALGAQNAPDSSWFIGEVYAHADTYIIQKVIAFTDPNDTVREFERSKINSVWQPWIETSPRKLFTSVSNGKAAIANAITGKGVPTSATAEFATMAANINAIATGGYTTGTIGVGPNTNVVVGGFNYKPKFVVIIKDGYIATAISTNQTIIYNYACNNSGQSTPLFVDSIGTGAFTIANLNVYAMDNITWYAIQ